MVSSAYKWYEPRGSTYKENKTGPITEPWGTPKVIGAVTKSPYVTRIRSLWESHGLLYQKHHSSPVQSELQSYLNHWVYEDHLQRSKVQTLCCDLKPNWDVFKTLTGIKPPFLKPLICMVVLRWDSNYSVIVGLSWAFWEAEQVHIHRWLCLMGWAELKIYFGLSCWPQLSDW